MLNRQLNFTQGVVSAEAGIGDDDHKFSLTAPIQPGNSGGPIFNDRSQVVGVAVATYSPSVAEAQGFSPQNINWAIKISVLRDFLRTNGVDYRTTSVKPRSGSGVSAEIRSSVVPVICYEQPASDPVTSADTDEVLFLPSLGSSPQWYLAEFSGLDFYGGDLEGTSTRGITLRQCQQLCADDRRCRIYTYNTRHSACFLKDDYIIAEAHPDAQSGLIYQASSPDALPQFPVKWQTYRERVFSGSPYARLTIRDRYSCIQECDRDGSCRAFMFAPSLNTRQCQLFGANPGVLMES